MGKIKNAEQESSARSSKPKDLILIVLCGPSHAGKSAFAKGFELQENFTVVSSDRIRRKIAGKCSNFQREAKVWEAFQKAKCWAIDKGQNVVLDACHISKRARLHALRGPNKHHRKICVVFDLPLRTLRIRCLKAKRVSLEEVERMWKDFQKSKPTEEELKREGFEAIYFTKE